MKSSARDQQRGPSPVKSGSWGTWLDADRLRREAFLLRTPAQRLQWLQEALEIAYSAGALELPGGTERSRDSFSSE